MRRPGLIGLIASVATAGAVVAAPVFASTSYVQVPLSSVFNAVALLDNGNTAPSTTASNSACHTTAGATFGNNNALSATGLPVGQTAKDANGVPYSIPQAGVKDAVCVTTAASTQDPGPTSVTIPVPSGNYSDAYFAASVENGPSLVDITPVYGGTAGTTITAVFDDWCGPVLVNGALTPDTVTLFPNADPRLSDLSGISKDSTPLKCTVYSTHVPGLDSSKTLTALKVSLVAGNTPLPTETGLPAGKSESTNGVLNIVALTLEGTTASTAVTGTSGSTTSTVPKTGSGPLPAVLGGLLLLAGALLVRRPRASRS